MNKRPENVSALIVAAGRGTRAGGPLPKQWQDIAGRPMLSWTLSAFQSHPRIGEIVLVLNKDDSEADLAQALPEPYRIALGGDTRAASVKSGLDLLGEDSEMVLIHDAARPCVSADLIDSVIDALTKYQAAAPALAVTDALWSGSTDLVTATVSRDGLFRAQTPQGFHVDKIKAAHAAFEGEPADDVEIARAAGLEVKIVTGEEDNLKVTTPEDFARAARILGGNVDIRTGNGFDVHRFGAGDHVMLCGVRIPHDRGLQGHSDADVGLHTLTDAIYGALAEGDIGRHFPPSDPQWKGAASHIFLKHAAGLANERGFRISNLDLTLMCERPKITPHADAMIDEVARITGLPKDRVSIKATTTEKLGFTGRGEGIAAQATATLVKS